MRGLGCKKLERETGFEPATSTLARSHSTTELLPPVLSFYSTCYFTDNSLHPYWHPLFVIRLFRISHNTAVRRETRDELYWVVPCLVTVVAQCLSCAHCSPHSRWYAESRNRRSDGLKKAIQ
jgi:hypothetical protein